ncbi:MAG TPA: AgmX/PglI C-terminal domain-containing protein [Polyangiaceae bacterium]|nr:AgmX/PglI C-terminal domain-containing protein [Polyangiaceae bacterium]
MPNTSLPPTPTHHGGRAFIGAVILMLLAMGGLLYWKFGGKEAPPPAVSAINTAPTAPHFDEAPPPPPPVEPDAGKKDEGPKKRTIVSSGGGGCSGDCKGEVGAQLRSALSGAAGSVRGCYERALRQNQMLQGKLLVSVTIGSHGQACGASLASDSLGDPSVASCVLQKFRSGTFPAPTGGCVKVNVPISFMPKTGK